MTEKKWTKGPWAVGSTCLDDDLLPGACVDTAYGCEPSGTPNEIAAIVTSRHGDDWGQEDDANAHLIAAAPELYEAAEMLLEMLEMDGFGRDAAIDNARAAMAKARGESQ